MTLAEWIEAQAAIKAFWPHARELTIEQIRLQHTLVADLARDDVIAAIHAASRAGEPYPPTPGQIAQSAGRRLTGGAPSWPEAYALLAKAAVTFGRNREADALDWLQQHSQHAAEFVSEYGWRRWCNEPALDPDRGGAVLARIQRDYDQAIRQLDHDRDLGLPVLRVPERIAALRAGDTARPPRGLRRPALQLVHPTTADTQGA